LLLSGTGEVSGVSSGPYNSDESAGDVLVHVAKMVHSAMLDYGEWADSITPNARLDADLGMQSVEFSALQGYLTQRWGADADLTPLLRTLDLAGLADLTVAAIAAHISGQLAAGAARAGLAGTAPARHSAPRAAPGQAP
jgi:hypothetical protein